MPLFTDLLGSDGFVMGLMVLSALGALGVLMRAGVMTHRVRLVGMTAVALLPGTLCADAAPPEKPAHKVPPAADDESKTTTLTKMMEEADKELAKVDKDRKPQEAKKVETPKERDARLVTAQVEKKWRLNLLVHRDAASAGRVEVVFYINTEGKLEDIRVVDDKQSHLALTEVTLRAIMEAKIPPMPADVISSLPMNDPKRLKIEYTALIYTEPKDSKSTKGETKAVAKDDKTAKGRYARVVFAQVDKKLKAYQQERVKDVSAGSLTAEFYVNKKGRVEDLRVLDDKKSNKLLTEFALQAIKDSEIPAMPADVIPLLPKNDRERLKIQYDAVIY